MLRIFIALSAVLVAVSAASSAQACSQAEQSASVAYLRTDCGSLSPCQTTLVGMSDWIDQCRVPTTASPLLVDVGPGTFNGIYYCNDWAGLSGAPSVFPFTNHKGHVTFRGAGRGVTRLRNDGSFFPLASPVLVASCRDIGFANLTLEGSRYGAHWLGGGNSTWVDVDVEVGGLEQAGFGWIELADLPEEGSFGNACDEENRALHYWFGSRIRARFDPAVASWFGAGYIASCGETWFYGGEIVLEGSCDEPEGEPCPGVAMGARGAAVAVSGTGEFRAFGTLIEARTGRATQAIMNSSLGNSGITAVVAGPDVYSGELTNKGVFHMHGGKIVADATGHSSSNATSLYADLDPGPPNVAMVHTPGTAFGVEPGLGGTGSRLRLSGSGRVMSPFLWPSGDDPPAIQSLTGQDLFVETSGAHPRLLIYQYECASGWFDTVTKDCHP